VHVPGSNWTLEVAPGKGWVPTWRPWVLAVVVIVSCLIGLLLAAILVSARLQTWLKVRGAEGCVWGCSWCTSSFPRLFHCITCPDPVTCFDNIGVF
jgi:hypothetical protein